MDEQKWLTCDNARSMIFHLRDELGAARTKVGRRKLRLFQAACFRQIWEVLDGPVRDVVEALEQHAEGQAVGRDLAQLHGWAIEYLRQSGYSGFPFCLACALYRATAAEQLVVATHQVSRDLGYAHAAPDAPHAQTHPEYVISRKTAQRRHAGLLREIFGNPFRPPTKRKFPAEIVGLAQACYDDHAHYPVLADALDDLGEAEAAAHCRLSGHVKGCHVVDWILGKA
jgi:hypothetical protein